MNKCPKCFNEVKEEHQFCRRCGFDMKTFLSHSFTVCPECGQTYLEPTVDCIKCGYTTEPKVIVQETGYENKVAGTVGAFIFAAAGGIVYFLLNKIGFVASVSGLVGIVCALKGYEQFGKKLSKYGVIISLVATVFMVVVGWYAGLTQDVYDAYRSWYAEGYVNYIPSFGECMTFAYMFLFEEGIGSSYMLNLLLGLGFTALGCWRTAKTAMMNQASANMRPAVPVLRENPADTDGPAAGTVEPAANASEPAADTGRTEKSGENESNTIE